MADNKQSLRPNSLKDPNSKKPVTVIVKRTVKVGREAEYEQWVKDTTEDLKAFPGYMDITMIRPTGAKKEYVLIIRFDSYKHVQDWENSDIRNKWMERAKPFTEEVSNQKITGLEYWFPLPEIPKAAVPPRYKMVVVTILAIYPLSLIVNFILGYLLPPQTPMLLRGLITAILMVICMTYLVMPKMTSLFRSWLFPKI
jgi:uncharacterized protein